MRNKWWIGVSAVLVALAGGSPAAAQGLGGFGQTNVGSDTLIDAGGLPGQPRDMNYLTSPLGNPGKQGPFLYMDTLYYAQTWTLGKQLVAWRGLQDTTGAITTVPGTYIGSGVRALSTDQFGRSGYTPGFNLGAGFKFDDGSTITARIMHLTGQTYGAGATLATQYARNRADLVDSFLVSGVFNFPPEFGGPARRTAIEGQVVGRVVNPVTGAVIDPGRVVPDRAFYGVWNGASNMVIEYKRWYNEAEIGGRTPILDSGASKVFALGGVRYHMFMDRFSWLSQIYDLNGNTGGRNEARYSNILSQRMYGPYIGCSHDWYLKDKFSLSTDLTAGLMINFAKERAKYELGDESIQVKRSVREIDLVPTAGGNVNLWWYPTKGVQVRVGYSANTFYNTLNQDQPIGFNYGGLDPVYGRQAFRMIHGLNIGFGIFF